MLISGTAPIEAVKHFGSANISGLLRLANLKNIINTFLCNCVICASSVASLNKLL